MRGGNDFVYTAGDKKPVCCLLAARRMSAPRSSLARRKGPPFTALFINLAATCEDSDATPLYALQSSSVYQALSRRVAQVEKEPISLYLASLWRTEPLTLLVEALSATPAFRRCNIEYSPDVPAFQMLLF